MLWNYDYFPPSNNNYIKFNNLKRNYTWLIRWSWEEIALWVEPDQYSISNSDCYQHLLAYHTYTYLLVSLHMWADMKECIWGGKVRKATRTHRWHAFVFHCCFWWTVSGHKTYTSTCIKTHKHAHYTCTLFLCLWKRTVSQGIENDNQIQHFGFSQSPYPQLSVFPPYPSHHTHTHSTGMCR